MNIEQSGFCFDAPLTTIPASQLPPPVKLPELPQDLVRLGKEELIERVIEISRNLPDEIAYFDALLVLGFPQHAITGWHSARMLDALLPPLGEFQAYIPTPGQVRFRRLPPLMACPGEGCSKATLGGIRCAKCAEIEKEDLWNQD